jgi:hypothetical protein
MRSLPTKKDEFIVEFNVSLHEVQDIANKLFLSQQIIRRHKIKCSMYLSITTQTYSDDMSAKLTVEGTVNGDIANMMYTLNCSGQDKFITVDLSKFDRR